MRDAFYFWCGEEVWSVAEVQNELVAWDGDHFAGHQDVGWTVRVGGFFIVVTVPFNVDDDLLESCARKHGVPWTPMRHFYGGTGGGNQLQLSCSSLDSEQIEDGLNRLAAFFADQGAHSLRPRRKTRS